MRRFLLTFFLLFLPLQAIWAAASPYCGHESVTLPASPSVAHFGHHAHEHTDHGTSAVGVNLSSHPAFASDASDFADTGGDIATPHADCHVCHGAGCGVAATPRGTAVEPPPAVLMVQARLKRALLPMSRPERPKWPALA